MSRTALAFTNKHVAILCCTNTKTVSTEFFKKRKSPATMSFPVTLVLNLHNHDFTDLTKSLAGGHNELYFTNDNHRHCDVQPYSLSEGRTKASS